MTFQRDPVSEVFDPLARRALARCYENPGRWVPARLPRLTARVYLAWLAYNTDLRERDPWDENLTRWARSFTRSCYHNHRWYGDFGGLRQFRRTAPWNGLRLACETARDDAGWHARLNAFPEESPPRGHRRAPDRPDGMNRGIRPGGTGTAGGVL